MAVVAVIIPAFIAQEMEEAILNNGLTTMDVASLVKDPNEEGYSGKILSIASDIAR